MNWKRAVSIAVMLLLAVPWFIVKPIGIACDWLGDRIYKARWGVHKWANPQLYRPRFLKVDDEG